MKILLTAIFAVVALAAPAVAQTISDVDHPDIPNCTIVGPNAPNCENLTIQAVYAHNGIGTKTSYKDSFGHTHSFYTW